METVGLQKQASIKFNSHKNANTVLLQLPPELLLQVLKFVEPHDLTSLRLVNHFFRDLLKNNIHLLIHMRINDNLKPALVKRFNSLSLVFNNTNTSTGTNNNDSTVSNNNNYNNSSNPRAGPVAFLNATNRLNFLRQDAFMQKVLLTRAPAIHIESVFNKFVSNQLVLLNYLTMRHTKMRLTLAFAHRPSRKLLIEKGILKSGVCTINFHINVLKKNKIEDVLKNFVKSYRYNRHLNHNVSKNKMQNSNSKTASELSPSKISSIIAKLNDSFKAETSANSGSVQKSDYQVLLSIKIKNKQLYFEKLLHCET